MPILIDDRFEEIDLCIQNDDLNRGSQRLLELSYEFPFEITLRQQALKLRKTYNEGKELGVQKHSSEQLSITAKSLLNSLKSSSPELTFEEQSSRRPLAIIQGIRKSFNSRLHNFEFKAINLEIKPGNIIGLVGENGNGKTTLLRMIAGDLSPDEGKIIYQIEGSPTEEWEIIKKHIAFIPQRLQRWYGKAEDKVSFEAAIKGFNKHLNDEKLEFIIQRSGLHNFRELSWKELSSGYKLRFEIAMALVWEPKVLILDEPLANLDLQAQEILLQDLRNLANSARNPVSIILSSQQLHEVETISDQIIFLKNGKAVFNGSLEDFKNVDSHHSFEVLGSFNYTDLNKILGDWKELKIEQSASSFLISCNSQHSKEELLKRLISAGHEIEYFRNISGSTKKLFSDKY